MPRDLGMQQTRSRAFSIDIRPKVVPVNSGDALNVENSLRRNPSRFPAHERGLINAELFRRA